MGSTPGGRGGVNPRWEGWGQPQVGGVNPGGWGQPQVGGVNPHRAKSEISYVFYVDDRCRIGLIHMSATNPIDEI